MRAGPILAVAILACAGAAGWYWLGDATSLETAPQRGARRAANRDGPVPVSVAAVKKETVPVYREGIGNVQAQYSVTVRSQIDGRLASVDFAEGQIVRKGEVLARIDPVVFQAQYNQAVAKKAQDVATLTNARLDLNRYVNLAKTNAGPQQQADQQAATVAQLEAQVKSDEAAIDNAKAYLDYCVISAPFEGRVGLRQVDPGNVVHAADSNGIVLLTQIRPITVVFTLPQRDLPVVSAALGRGSVSVEAMESGKQVLATGTLQTLDNQIDVTTGTIKLKALFANADDKLWPGQFVSTRVVVSTFVDARVVPAAAIRRGPIGTFVYVVDDDAHAIVRPVEVLLLDETRAVIGKGVDVGASVVTVGFAQLANKRPVQIVPDVAPAKPEYPVTPERAASERTPPEQRGAPRREGPAHGPATRGERPHKNGEGKHSKHGDGAREAQQ
jgi:multidrug efflux system membrane fusion protein